MKKKFFDPKKLNSKNFHQLRSSDVIIYFLFQNHKVHAFNLYHIDFVKIQDTHYLSK
jgi:hypothetical protein